MPRRSIFSSADRESLLAIPDTESELVRLYTLSESDLSIIRQHRGAANRLGFAVQLCYMRYPGSILDGGELPFPPLLHFIGAQPKVPVESWSEYGQWEQTRREHLVELQSVFGFQSFTLRHYRPALHALDDLASQTDKGILLAAAMAESLRSRSIGY
jgi:TnpA family transposase